MPKGEIVKIISKLESTTLFIQNTFKQSNTNNIELVFLSIIWLSTVPTKYNLSLHSTYNLLL
jgi:hypothetical protein